MANNAILEWDKEGERWLENGTRHGILFTSKRDTSTAPGAGATSRDIFKYKYGIATAWNGLTSATESPQGAEANDIYADDIKYASIRSAETFNGTIESFTYPKDEWPRCDGSYVPDDAPGISFGQQTRDTFGFAFESQVFNDTATDADDLVKLHLWYGCTANPSDRQYQTFNESPEGISFSWEVTSTPVVLEGDMAISGIKKKVLSTITVESGKAEYFYDDLVKVLKGHYKTPNGEFAAGAEIAEGYLPTPADVYDIYRYGYDFENCQPYTDTNMYTTDNRGHRVYAKGPNAGQHVLDSYGRLTDSNGAPVIEVAAIDGVASEVQVNVYGDPIIVDDHYLAEDGSSVPLPTTP